MRTILLVGEDERLQDTRPELLRRIGAEVQRSSVREAVALLKTQRFDVVVVCHSLSLQEKIEITSLAHQQCADMRVLQLVSPRMGMEEQYISADASALAEPRSLIEKVTELLDS